MIFMKRGADAPGKEIIMIKVNSLEEMPEGIGGVSAEERETIIRKDCSDGKAHICTTDYVEYGKLMRKCREVPDKYKALGYDTCGGQAQTGYFECPSKLVSYRSGKDVSHMTEEQRAAAAERMRAVVAARKAGRKEEL